MKFPKEILAEIAYNDAPEGYEKIEDTIVDHTRWDVHHKMIFKYDDKYYSSYYSRGATEYQDTGPYEYDAKEVECPEVVAVEKTIKVWEPK